MKTVMGSKKTVQRNWVVIDVKDKVLGRVSSTIASVLRGKHKPIFTPHADCGDFVVVINADKVRLTGKKWKDKKYIHHTMYPGGLVEFSAEQAVQRKPTRLVEDARVRPKLVEQSGVAVLPCIVHECQRRKLHGRRAAVGNVHVASAEVWIDY